MAISNFTDSNQDVFFLLYNSFNDFYEGLELSSTYYVQELQDRASQRSEIELVLFVLAIVALAVCLIVLIPVVHSVNQQKDKVLSLFCEIDNAVIRVLVLKCERFINGLQTEEGNEDLDSNEELENNLASDEEDEYSLLGGGLKRTKKAKGRTKTNKMFFVKFVLAMACVLAYYIQNYFVS